MGWFNPDRDFLAPNLLKDTLDTRECLKIIRYYVIYIDFCRHNIDRSVIWQKDGAPCHTSNATMQYLCGQFPGISLRRYLPWPSRSPYPTVCDFFLWDYLKRKTCVMINHLRQLREAIIAECRNIDVETIQRSFDNMVERAKLRTW